MLQLLSETTLSLLDGIKVLSTNYILSDFHNAIMQYSLSAPSDICIILTFCYLFISFVTAFLPSFALLTNEKPLIIFFLLLRISCSNVAWIKLLFAKNDNSRNFLKPFVITWIHDSIDHEESLRDFSFQY